MGNAAKTTVELDIFSGRANPSWTLAQSDAGKLQKLIESLQQGVPGPPPFSGLGYRGFIIRSEQSGLSVRAALGFVYEGELRRVDIARKVENLLIETARAYVAPPLLSDVIEQIKPQSDVD